MGTLMNRPTRKAFLVLFVACVFLIVIACFFKLSLFFKVFQSISGNLVLPSFFKCLGRLVK